MRISSALCGALLGSALAVGVGCNALVGVPDDVASLDASPGATDGAGGVGPGDSTLPDSGPPAPLDAGNPYPSMEAGSPPGDGSGGSPEAAPGDDGGSGDGAPPPADSGADPTAVCNGATVDLYTSAQNCGACGHDCKNARCAVGLCEPAQVAGSNLEERGLWSLYALTYFNGTLYGTDWYRPFCGVYDVGAYLSVTQPNPLVTYAASVSATAITHDDSQLYFGIFRDETTPVPNAAAGLYALTPGGAPSLLFQIGGIDQIAVDAKYLYWANHSGYIFRSNKDGTQAAWFSLGTTNVTRIVASGGLVYFLSSGALVRATPPDLGTTTPVSDVGAPAVWDVDSTNVYWFDATAKTIRSRPISLQAPSKDITPPGGFAPPNPAQALAIDSADATNLIIVTTTTQAAQIHRVKTDGSARAQLLIDSSDGVYGFTQDGSTLFYTTYGSGSLAPPYSAVWRVEKPAP